MDWKERIRQAQQEQKETEEEAERALAAEHQKQLEQNQRKLEVTRQRQDEALRLLDQLGVKEALTGIRDQLWKLGKVEVAVGEKGVHWWETMYSAGAMSYWEWAWELMHLGEWDSNRDKPEWKHFHETVSASYTLSFQWPVYEKGYSYSYEQEYDHQYGLSHTVKGYRPSRIIKCSPQILAVRAVPRAEAGNFFIFFVSTEFRPAGRGFLRIPEETDPHSRMEEFLTEDCLRRNRKFPYDKRVAESITEMSGKLKSDPELASDERGQAYLNQFLQGYPQFRQ